MICIYSEILKNIKPTAEQRKHLLDFSNNLMSIINEFASENHIEVECRLVGSVAKKTSLIGKADIDIFMAFPLKYSESKLKECGLLLGKYCIEQVGGKSEKRYASHPYITGLIDGFEIDFVPCYKIKDASELKSAVDRTILHTEYIQKNMSDKQTEEVLLLKKFMSCINTYGANYKVSGFSGYLCELLILKYETFENTLINASSWHPNYKIDLENYNTSNNFKTPLVFIDPTDGNRNVSAALSMQKFSEFIVASRNYLKNQSIDFFENKKITIDNKNLITQFKKRNTKTLILTFNVPDLSNDVIYPQINKTTQSLEKISSNNDFTLIGTKYYITKDNMAHIILEYERYELPNIKIHNGPLIKDQLHSDKFITKYPNAHINNNKWNALVNREFTTIESFIHNILKEENMHLLKIGKNVKEELKKKYTLVNIIDYINQCDDEEKEEIFLYLNPTFKLTR